MADGDLKREHFPFWFDFGRLTAQPYRNEDGRIILAAPGVPRFTHDEAGVPLGLLVDAAALLGTGDRVTLQAGALDGIAGAECTVLHAVTLPDGSAERRAWYSRNGRATVNALLATAAVHARIAVIDSYLQNRGGFVRCRGESWLLANAIGADAGVALADDGDRPLIEQ